MDGASAASAVSAAGAGAGVTSSATVEPARSTRHRRPAFTWEMRAIVRGDGRRPTIEATEKSVTCLSPVSPTCAAT